MAGSYKHVTNSDGTYNGMGLIDDLGDATEAIEEMHWMIGYLSGGDLHKIFEAHRAYVAAADGYNNSDHAATLTEEDFWVDYGDD